MLRYYTPFDVDIEARFRSNKMSMFEITIAPGIFVSVETQANRSTEPIMVSIRNAGPNSAQVTLRLFFIGRTMEHQSVVASPTVVRPGEAAGVALELESALPNGPYALSASVSELGEDAVVNEGVSLPYIALWIGKDVPDDIERAAQAAREAQREYRSKPIYAANYAGPTKYTVHVILEGCLLDYPQYIESGAILPLRFGFSYESEVAAVNRLCQEDAFSIEPAIDDSWQRNHPLTLISYSTVFAPSEYDAHQTVVPRIGLLTGVLAMIRSAASRHIASLVCSEDGRAKLIMPAVPYHGNLVGGLEVSRLSRELDDFIDAVARDPWLDLMIRMYNSAVMERDLLFRVFRLWSVLESCAKRRVLAGFQSCSIDSKKSLYVISGELVNGKDLAKVSFYTEEIIPLKAWNLDPSVSNCEFLRRAYIVRNIAAHEGVINRESLTDDKLTAVDFVNETSSLAALRELTQFALSTEKRYSLKNH